MYNQIPYMLPAQSASTASSLLGKINWSSLLSNAQKTLNVVNQAIPLYYQVKPMVKNLRTLGKIGSEFTKLGGSKENTTPNATVNQVQNNTLENNQIIENELVNDNTPLPRFFL